MQHPFTILKEDLSQSTQYYKGVSVVMQKIRTQVPSTKSGLIIAKDSIMFVGIGDTVEHYSGEKARIIKMKQRTFDENKILYNYFPLNEDLGKLAQEWTKHDAALSNITKVLEYSKETLEIKNNWWEVENKRREELPRYICVKDYPKNRYTVGEVIKCFSEVTFEIEKEHVEKINFFEKWSEFFKKTTKEFNKMSDIGVFDLE